jgi:hypothetical protein
MSMNPATLARWFRPIFKLVPVVSLPRTFSKLRLINALMSRNLWSAARSRFSLPESEISTIFADAVSTKRYNNHIGNRGILSLSAF